MRVLILLLLAASTILVPHGSSAAEPPVRELFLAGGALAVCSDLAPRACRTAPGGGRTPARYRLDADGIARALDPALWSAGAPAAETRAALLQGAADALSAHAQTPAGIEATVLEDALAGVCLVSDCAESDPQRPWSQLLDLERSAVLAALEVPLLQADGQRVRERADPAASRVDSGVQVLRAFVAAAATRSAGRPRIAVVTASAFDPMDPVDFYRSLFRELGADAVWWPVDAAVAAARFEVGDCDALPGLRVQRLKLTQRERIDPDLAAEQLAYCRTQPNVPADVQGVFFAGGDQWRLRQAFVTAEDRPNAWLAELQRAHAAGRVVVGGTSAGAAVQSGSWMLSNGSVEAALSQPASTAAPPEPGCGRADRCGAGRSEDQLGLWSAGGLRLAAGAIVDTHFSERARELRLLIAMQLADARWGYGADETSALQVREIGDRREIRAVGERGGWVLHRPAGETDAALAWYLVPGATLRIDGDAVELELDGDAESPRRPSGPAPASAFDSGALRALAQRLAWRCGRGLSLSAGDGQAELRCLTGSQAWRSATGWQGVGPLALTLQRD